MTMYYLLTAAALYALGLAGGRTGRYAVAAGLLVHGTFIARRALLLGRLPVTERLDILSLVSFLIIILYAVLTRLYRLKDLEYYLIPLAALFAFTALFHEPVNTVDIFMVSPWFYVFSAFNVLAYAFLGAGAALCLYHVINDDEALLEPLGHRYTLYGWVFFSVSLLTGSVWFFLSYGSYWYWTAKEFWSSLIWLYYGIYLHSRYLKSFRGRPASFVGLLGYPLVLFHYFGIGTVIKSPWSQF
jgi:ABC-type transport system involved in cytochrome c biogenesis permease subunit